MCWASPVHWPNEFVYCVLVVKQILLKQLCDQSGRTLSANLLLVPLHAVKIALFTWKLSINWWKHFLLAGGLFWEFFAEHPFSLQRGAVSECNIRQMQLILRILSARGKHCMCVRSSAAGWLVGHFHWLFLEALYFFPSLRTVHILVYLSQLLPQFCSNSRGFDWRQERGIFSSWECMKWIHAEVLRDPLHLIREQPAWMKGTVPAVKFINLVYTDYFLNYSWCYITSISDRFKINGLMVRGSMHKLELG